MGRVGHFEGSGGEVMGQNRGIVSAENVREGLRKELDRRLERCGYCISLNYFFATVHEQLRYRYGPCFLKLYMV